jgi:TonB family protein
MAFRALLFSKGPDTNAALTTACQSAGIHLEICDDIFSAIEKGTKQPFSCVLVNWSDQPEAGFLLKRARESKPNLNTVAIAIVEREPTPAEMRDHRLSLLIYRPIAVQEAQEVLAKASEKMPQVSAQDMPQMPKPAAQSESSASAAAPAPSEQNQPQYGEAPAYPATSAPDDAADEDIDAQKEEIRPSSPRFSLGAICAAVLVLSLAYCLWNARDAISYLANTRENRANIFKQSIAAVLDGTRSPAPGAVADAPPDDPYFKRNAGSSDGHPKLGVLPDEASVADSRVPLRNPSDFPLPTPIYEQPAPVKAPRGGVPDSLRGSAPIAPPVVVTVNPAQIMPVSSPALPAFSTQQFSEPVTVTEQAERALLVHSVDPAYPPEAAAQKLSGPVVLQATIGRDGSVEDLKIVRGSFVLSKAAIAAVKQWRFQPYTVGGHPVQTQTFLTINFTSPTS